jgi:hypothetical protein
MIPNPDSPRAIRKEQFEEKVWLDLCDELGREPTDEEYEDGLASSLGAACDHAYDTWRDEQMLRGT